MLELKCFILPLVNMLEFTLQVLNLALNSLHVSLSHSLFKNVSLHGLHALNHIGHLDSLLSFQIRQIKLLLLLLNRRQASLELLDQTNCVGDIDCPACKVFLVVVILFLQCLHFAIEKLCYVTHLNLFLPDLEPRKLLIVIIFCFVDFDLFIRFIVRFIYAFLRLLFFFSEESLKHGQSLINLVYIDHQLVVEVDLMTGKCVNFLDFWSERNLDVVICDCLEQDRLDFWVWLRYTACQKWFTLTCKKFFH